MGRIEVTRVVVAVVLGLALLGCGRDKPDWRVHALLGGTDNLAAVGAPVELTVYRVHPEPRRKGEPEVRGPVTGPFRLTSDKTPVPTDAGRRLSAVLTSEATYDWQRVKRTPWTPRLGLTFVRAGVRVDVLLCLDTDQMLVFQDELLIGFEDVDAAHDELVAALLLALPDDPYVATLAQPRLR